MGVGNKFPQIGRLVAFLFVCVYLGSLTVCVSQLWSASCLTTVPHMWPVITYHVSQLPHICGPPSGTTVQHKVHISQTLPHSPPPDSPRLSQMASARSRSARRCDTVTDSPDLKTHSFMCLNSPDSQSLVVTRLFRFAASRR